ncbi:MAG: hypothetical protein ABSB78_14955, partial [Bacteroidota bacterium]
MNRTIGRGWRSLRADVSDKRKELAWQEKLLANCKPLDEIADIVRLGCLYDSPKKNNGRWCLKLDYIGKHRNAEDARP